MPKQEKICLCINFYISCGQQLQFNFVPLMKKGIFSKIKTDTRQYEPEFYSWIADISEIAFFKFDRNFKLLEINNILLERLGYKADELSGKNVTLFISDSSKEAFMHSFSGKPERKPVEIRFCDKNMFELPHDVYFFKPEDESMPVGCLCIEIDKLAKTLKSISKSEEKYRILSELTADAASSALIFPNGSIQREWSITRLTDLFGYEPEDLDSVEKWEKFVHPDDKTLFYSSLSKIKLGKDICEEFRVITKSGQTRWLSNSIFVRPVEGAIRVISAAKDITDRKTAEENLKKSEENYRSLSNNIPDCVIRLTPSLEYAYINPAGRELLSLEENPPETNNNSIDPIHHFIKSNSNKCIQNKTMLELQSESNGKFYEWKFVPELKDAGIQSVLVIARDITQLKNSEKEIKEARDIAEKNDRLKSAFLANMSHEIRTPLNAILGFTQLLKDGNQNKETTDKIVDILNNSGNQLLSVINDIMDISKIEAGELLVKLAGFNIYHLLEEIYQVFAGQAKLNNHKICVRLLPLPEELTKNPYILGDRLKVQQILINLMGNALKYTHKGSIELGCGIRENNLLFFVKDTGIGIHPDHYKMIFEPFRQADDSDARKYGGTGLGLAICKSLVQLMGGQIWLESKMGIGSAFYFTIPFTPSRSDSNELIQTISNSVQHLENTVALVVEDDPVNMYFITSLLKKNKIQFLKAGNGKLAVEMVKNHPEIDIVLMDIQLPILDGYDATRQIKQIRPQLPVIAQTAYALYNERENCLKAGCNDYLSKPIKPNLLFDKMALLLQNKKTK